MRSREVLQLPFDAGPYGMASVVYDDVRRSTPVCRARVPSGWETWLFTRYADIAKVLKDPTFSRDEAVRVGAALVANSGVELEPGILQNIDGAEHRQVRDLFGRHFGPGHEAAWTETIRRETVAALDELAPTRGTSFDLRADFFEPIAARCAQQLFGFPPFRGPDVLENFFDRGLNDELRSEVAARFRDPTFRVPGMLFTTLAEAADHGSVDRGLLINNVMILVTATFQAVASPFLSGIFALLRDRSQWLACVADRAVRTNAVEEMLRLFPNGDLIFLRIATSNCVVGGVGITRGDAVLAPTAAANTDPAMFADARRFDCRRGNSHKHIAFGIGKHFCVGGMISRTWLNVVLEVLLERLPTLELAVAPDQVAYRTHPLINILETLPVVA